MSEKNEIETPDLTETAVDPKEVDARSKGWVSHEEWIEQGKNPADYVGLNRFIEKGEMISEMNKLKGKVRSFDERLENVNALHKVELEHQIEQLKSAKKEAVRLGDNDQVEQLDEQIDGKKEAIQNLIPKVDPEASQIENDYYGGLSLVEKGIVDQVALPMIQAGLSGQDLVDALKEKVNKELPQTNSRRQEASVTDTPRKSKAKDEITMDSLSKDDVAFLQVLKNSRAYRGKSEKEIFQALKDSKR